MEEELPSSVRSVSGTELASSSITDWQLLDSPAFLLPLSCALTPRQGRICFSSMDDFMPQVLHCKPPPPLLVSLPLEEQLASVDTQGSQNPLEPGSGS